MLPGRRESSVLPGTGRSVEARALAALAMAVCAGAGYPTTLAGQPETDWDPFVEVYVPHTPVLAFPADGELHAAYELHITNLTNSPMDLERVEVLRASAVAAKGQPRLTPSGGGAPPGDAPPLLRLEDVRLRNALMRPGLGDNPERPQRIGPGLRAVVWVWLDLKGVAHGKLELEHALTIRRPDVSGGRDREAPELPTSEAQEATPEAEGAMPETSQMNPQRDDVAGTVGRERVLRIAPVRLETLAPIVIGPPLRGGPWIAGNGPSNFTHHRRALIPMEGRVRIAQRFAIDYALLGDDGRPWAGDQAENASYHGYGADVLAVADGTVVDAKDGIPENVPGLTSRAVEITMATVAGNYVTLKIGEHRYAFYAHLQPGSLRVRVGDRVRRGDVLGLLGNSGNSTAPHLHFHVSDGNSPLGAEGIPYAIDAFDVIGRGPFWNRERATAPVRREEELPLANMVVRFPDSLEPDG